MYGKYFSIDESAFSIAPNPKYLYLSPQHQEALAHLLYGVTRPGGFVLITGEIGTGKTTICRSLFLEIPEETDIALIINPKLNPNDLLASICDELKISYSKLHPSPKTYISKLNEHLIKTHAEGRNTILIIDEAQNLSEDALEHIRVLTNLETDEQKLLQIILIGQPELRDRLNSPRLEQLNQRITARFHLQALNPKQVKEYVRHRLKIGDGDEELFSNSNINYIYKLTGGVPRLVNVLCDRALLGAYVNRKKKITNEIIQKAARESLGTRVKRRAVGVNWALAATLSIAGLLVAATVLIFLYEKNPELFAQAQQVSSADNIVQPPQSQPTSVEPSEISPPPEVAEFAAAPAIVASVPPPEPSGEQVSETEKIEIQSSDFEPAVVEPLPENIPELVNFTPRQLAFKALFETWQIDYEDADTDPCDFAKQHELLCYSGQGDIFQLQRLNRPAILVLERAPGELEFPVIQQMQKGEVIVVETTGEYRVTWEEIENNWQGKFVLLWKPLSTVANIKPNSQGDHVKEIDRNISIILNRPPGSGDIYEYNASLVREVQTFQRMQRIAPDGVIGPLTQMYMNNLVRSDIPKLR